MPRAHLAKLAVPAAIFALTLAAANVASADTGTNVPIGTGSVGSGPGFGYSNWNGSTNVVYVGVRTGTMAGGYCQDSLYDWATSNGSHYDARATRTCDSNTSYQGPTLTDQSQVTGMQKFGTCYGPDQNTQSTGGCVNDSRRTSTVSGIPVNWCSFSVRSDTRARGGFYPCSGGSPTSSSS